jgi:purine-binding chemotaxis protein CheW
VKTGENTDAHLVCRSGSRLCAIPLTRVAETMRPLPVEPLAGMPPFVLGLAIIRGSPTPVVDTGQLLGVENFHAARFVTVKMDGRLAALAVDAIVGVRALPEASLTDLPPLLRDASTELIMAVGTLDAALLLLLETSRLVPEPVWSALEGAGAPS